MKMLLSVTVLVLAYHYSLGQSMFESCIIRSIESGQVAYGSHDTDCDKFIQCRYSEEGGLEDQIQQCAFSTYWNNDTLTCTRAFETYCPTDKCIDRPTGWEYQGDHGNCRGYWSCENGKSVAKCCPQGQHYNGTWGCVDNDEVDECSLVTCLNDAIVLPENETAVNETVVEVVCEKKAVAGNPSWYQFELPGHGVVRMPCSAGTVFNDTACACGFPVVTIKQTPTCTREVHLTFDDDERDVSGKNNHVANRNVIIENGTAKFNGRDSLLIIPRFNNLEHASKVVIKVNYTSDHSAPGLSRAIISNSGICTTTPTILLSEDSSNVYFGIGTTNSSFVFTNLEHNDTVESGMASEKSVVYDYDGATLTGSDVYNTTEVPVSGYVRPVHCPLYVGYAKELAPFEGEIDELEIYLCDPDM